VGVNIEKWMWPLSSRNVTLYVPCYNEIDLQSSFGNALKSQVRDDRKIDELVRIWKEEIITSLRHYRGICLERLMETMKTPGRNGQCCWRFGGICCLHFQGWSELDKCLGILDILSWFRVTIDGVWIGVLNLLTTYTVGWFDIHFTVLISCERAAPPAEKNAAARHHVLRSLISLHNEHPV
jgi:hypothetical protein